MNSLYDMGEQLRQDWINELRSGKYEQGQGALKTFDNKYCCLGVLCELIDPNAWKAEEVSDVDCDCTDCTSKYAWNGNNAVIPAEFEDDLRHLFGMTVNDFAEINDAGVGFDQIAKWIEEQRIPDYEEYMYVEYDGETS